MGSNQSLKNDGFICNTIFFKDKAKGIIVTLSSIGIFLAHDNHDHELENYNIAHPYQSTTNISRSH